MRQALLHASFSHLLLGLSLLFHFTPGLIKILTFDLSQFIVMVILGVILRLGDLTVALLLSQRSSFPLLVVPLVRGGGIGPTFTGFLCSFLLLLTCHSLVGGGSVPCYVSGHSRCYYTKLSSYYWLLQQSSKGWRNLSDSLSTIFLASLPRSCWAIFSSWLSPRPVLKLSSPPWTGHRARFTFNCGLRPCARHLPSSFHLLTDRWLTKKRSWRKNLHTCRNLQLIVVSLTGCAFGSFGQKTFPSRLLLTSSIISAPEDSLTQLHSLCFLRALRSINYIVFFSTEVEGDQPQHR